MSADSVDDLEYAEGRIAELDLDLADVDAWSDYCRPTCGADEGECKLPETCGCPCHDREDK